MDGDYGSSIVFGVVIKTILIHIQISNRRIRVGDNDLLVTRKPGSRRDNERLV